MVIFAVLCLTVFAVLTLSTAAADKRMAAAAAAAVGQYYEADCKAEEILGLLRAGTVPEEVSRDGDRYSYSCPVTETSELCVEVCVTEDEYEIIKWQVVATAEWSPEEYIEVWTPEMEE